ncbi:MAG: hypothetical protein KBA75_07035, partial [Alphaproteobacteria bacterium]|nr:hypothetical protein [Alphaproteobacteria bacterium]
MIASPANAAVSNPNCDWNDVATASNCSIVDMRDNGLWADLSDEGALALAWYGLAANAGDAIGEHHMA